MPQENFPFLDGNGRIGRLLISLLVVIDNVLTQPFLYLSLYFKEHRADYHDALQRVRTHGDWGDGSDTTSSESKLWLARQLGVTRPTAKSALQRLEKLGIAREITGRRRDRIYSYQRQLEILDRGTGPQSA